MPEQGQRSQPGSDDGSTSLDAAQLGVYMSLLDAACTLSRDPAPQVAAAAKTALQNIGVEMVTVGLASAASGTASFLKVKPVVGWFIGSVEV